MGNDSDSDNDSGAPAPGNSNSNSNIAYLQLGVPEYRVSQMVKNGGNVYNGYGIVEVISPSGLPVRVSYCSESAHTAVRVWNSEPYCSESAILQ